MPEVEFEANGGKGTGYLAEPEGEGPGVIVIHEWWGLDDSMRRMVDRFAGEGFVALAPDLYEGETTEQPDEAEQKLMALNMDEAVKEMRGGVKRVLESEKCNGRIAAVGFCAGGGLAVWAATEDPDISAAVIYYYVMPHGKPDFSKLSGPVLGHFGTADEFIPPDAAKELEQEMNSAGVSTTFEFYEGAGHAFANDHDRLGTYNQEYAEQAWQRTVDFLKQNLS
jgi:carboxymethylenebutenolidase